MVGDDHERPVVSTALVGRDEQLRTLAAAASAAPAIVVVEGEAGVGKTRLVSELLARPDVRAQRVLVGRCHRIQEAFSLGVVIDAIRGLGDVLAGLDLSAVTGALRPLLPELAEVLPPAPEPLDDRTAERHRVFRALPPS